MSNLLFNILQCLIDIFIQPYEVSFIYFWQEVTFQSLNIYTMEAFSPVTNRKYQLTTEERMIKKLFYSWHLRWLENKVTEKIYNVYDHFSHTFQK